MGRKSVSLVAPAGRTQKKARPYGQAAMRYLNK